MALINMDLYNDLEKDVRDAKKNNEMYNIHLSTVKTDLKKRKAGWTARVVILAIWAVILSIVFLVSAGFIELGGSSDAAAPPVMDGDSSGEVVAPPPAEDEGIEWGLVGAALTACFVPMTWTLCFVGFPIGWNWSRDTREESKNQIYVQHTIYEDGTVDTYSSKFVPQASSFIFSVLQGCITMCFSVPIAIVQCFTWKGHIAKIEAIVKEIEESPELFVCD